MSNLQSFFINNIGLIIAILAVIGALFKAIMSKNKQQIFANIYGLISDAEKLIDATGADKFNYVFDLAYTKLPVLVKLFISENDIKMAIQYSFSKLQAFAEQQSKGTSTQATTNNVALDTSIKTGADKAVEVKQVTSAIDVPVNIADVSSAIQASAVIDNSVTKADIAAPINQAAGATLTQAELNSLTSIAQKLQTTTTV